MSTRQYEIFVVGSLLQSVQAQEDLYVSHWNGQYDYALKPLQELAYSLKSDKAYVITLQLHGKHGSSSTDIPPPPDVGSDVFIIDRDHEFS